MSDRAAGAISTIWTNPKAVLPQVSNPQRRRIPGAYQLVISGEVYTARLVPDPYNPRNADLVQFALAETKDAPPAALAAATEHGVGEMAVHVASPEELTRQLRWAIQTTRNRNTPNPSIAEQGIMDPPIGVATTFFFEEDEAMPMTYPVVREGSSRVSHGHWHLNVSANEVLHQLPRSASSMESHITRLNSYADKPVDEIEPTEQAAVRCAVTEFELIIGVEPDVPGAVDLSQAIKARVAQDHLNPKTRWTTESKNTSLAEECLLSARKADVLGSDNEAMWLGGYLTRDDASRLKIPPYGDDRAAWIIHMFTTNEKTTHDAIRAPIALVLTSDEDAPSRRRAVRVEGNTKLPLGIEVIARELHGAPLFPEAKVTQFRKLLKEALPRNLSTRGLWKRTKRTPEALFEAAFKELSDGFPGGPAGTELWVRAAYVLCKHGMIGGPRHDQGPEGDRRPAGEVLEALLKTEAGLRHLRQVLEDDRVGLRPRRVNDQGQPLKTAAGADVVISNNFLRDKLAPKDGVAEDSILPEDGARKRFSAAMETVQKSVRQLDDSMRNLAGIYMPGDAIPLVEQTGKPDILLLREDLKKLEDTADGWLIAVMEAQNGNSDYEDDLSEEETN
ncbi:hypothetical protein GCM10017600_45480 [Streptosporangium carneum]|uniref:Uncharacterized protein n=2 Tax=Streptosporangium carneum TaxID=47481 RepID=A0A9W6MEH6_9ACTN|nr:hypothetical protein GCM10017600_45480 [Streptosporangium carneum]